MVFLPFVFMFRDTILLLLLEMNQTENVLRYVLLKARFLFSTPGAGADIPLFKAICFFTFFLLD